MNEEEKEDIELDIEAKYVDKTEKEFLSRVTYAECLYILTAKNKYCDKIRELSVLKLCEIIEKLQKENIEQKAEIERRKHNNKTLKEFVSAVFNEELNDKYILTDKQYNAVIENAQNDINQKWIQKVQDKIEEKLKQEKEKYGNCLIKMYEDELVNRDIKILQELIEEREGK